MNAELPDKSFNLRKRISEFCIGKFFNRIILLCVQLIPYRGYSSYDIKDCKNHYCDISFLDI